MNVGQEKQVCKLSTYVWQLWVGEGTINRCTDANTRYLYKLNPSNIIGALVVLKSINSADNALDAWDVLNQDLANDPVMAYAAYAIVVPKLVSEAMTMPEWSL